LILDTEPGSQVGVLIPSNKVSPPGLRARKHGPLMATWDYPEAGGLFLFKKVPPVGAKFNRAKSKGPEGEAKVLSGPITGSVVLQVSAPTR